MLSFDEVAAATGARISGHVPDVELRSVVIDSRLVEPGSLFVCLRGARHDGHAFARAALSDGAVAILAQEGVDLNVPPDTPVLSVLDPLASLGQVAAAWRAKLPTTLIGVTGSSGKTSTKEMLAAYLSRFGSVGKTEANHNNELGVPLTLLSFQPDMRFGIVEMGMRAEGEIAVLARMAGPAVGVVTNVGTAHIGRLGSREAIARAKAELWQHLAPGGVAIAPWDDALASLEAARWGGRIVTWSLTDPGATVWSHDVQAFGEGQVFTAYWKAGPGLRHGRAEVRLPLWGDHHRANALAALAVGWALGLVPEARLEIRPDTLPGRARNLELGGVGITDDAYNANPESVRAALKAFSERPSQGRRIAVLGDMAELGDHTAEAHRGIGAYAATLALDELVAIGVEAPRYAEGCGDGLPCRVLGTPDEAVAYLLGQLAPGDRLLLKASRSARLERVLEGLAAAWGGARS
ncbi:MAG: UDP-N-acetylmuramoyl-tripeptide--D-alanyl-D-alanine ligase [Candidatus Sericytochromatia bacterium]|nr:UDP-N-acetylmuramoyl-tripeptide--D-alanyl-D-alanine ligase [Candidatus Sericytochromatia bacterium]